MIQLQMNLWELVKPYSILDTKVLFVLMYKSFNISVMEQDNTVTFSKQ
jgi:hypothetical protein